VCWRVHEEEARKLCTNHSASRPGESSPPPHPKNLNPPPLRGRTQTGMASKPYKRNPSIVFIRFGSCWLISYVAGGLRHLVRDRDIGPILWRKSFGIVMRRGQDGAGQCKYDRARKYRVCQKRRTVLVLRTLAAVGRSGGEPRRHQHPNP